MNFIDDSFVEFCGDFADVLFGHVVYVFFDCFLSFGGDEDELRPGVHGNDAGCVLVDGDDLGFGGPHPGGGSYEIAGFVRKGTEEGEWGEFFV